MGIDELQAKIRKLKNPTVLSLCPELSQLPPQLARDTAFAAAESYYAFCADIMQALKGIIPAVSVSFGCFAALGAEGVKAMQRVLALAKELDFYVLLDLMSCAGSPSADSMANACFGASGFTPYPCDGVIISAGIGSDGIRPFAGYGDKTVFLLARSANKSAREVQELFCGDRMAYQIPADLAMRLASDQVGKSGYAAIGLVAALTNPSALAALRKKYDKLFMLVPGLSEPNGHVKDAPLAFDLLGHGAAVIVGRSILFAYARKESDGSDFAEQAKAAAVSLREKLLGYIRVM